MTDRLKLYLDEDAQRTDLIQALRARQVDVESVSESSLLGQDDAFLLDYATSQERVIFTFNRGDFSRLHTEWINKERHHAGIIVSDQLATGVILRRLLRLIDAKSADEMRDWLEYLSNWR